MCKKEAIVDTCFFNKLSSEGKHVEDMKQVLDELEYKAIVPPYIWQHEMDVFPYFDKLVRDGYVRKVEYDEFLKEGDKELYTFYFKELHGMLVDRLEVGEKKNILRLPEPLPIDLFHYFKAKMSLGDVHMILMASFMDVPVIFTEDSDIDLLKTIAKNRLSYQDHELKIYSCIDLIKEIASKENSNISRKGLKEIVKHIGARNKWQDVVAVIEGRN